MQLTLSLDIPSLSPAIDYHSKILLIGSCFTEHIADRLAQHKFRVHANPHGILFNPLSVAYSLDSYLAEKQYTENDLFYLNELWNSWDHHTRFSDIDKEKALTAINEAQRQAAAFVRQATHIIITLGSAFQYYLKENGQAVANNHRAPSQWFEKRLLSVENITAALGNTLARIAQANPQAQIIFTISPVRHIRDGVIANNRSKARLIEAIHTLCDANEHIYYFPAYELVIDILRDYRFYDIDFVHPNYLATSFVWEHFIEACIAPDTRAVMQQVISIVTARAHRPRFPQTEAHNKFRAAQAEKISALLLKYPYLDLSEEWQYFM